MRTERIRIGHGVTLLPHSFNHPIRVAERVATLDILSKGRVEFGTGRSSGYEQAGFGVPVEESRAQWQEALGRGGGVSSVRGHMNRISSCVRLAVIELP